MKRSKRIPLLPTDRETAAYWESHSFAEHVRETTEAGIRFVRRPKRAISIRLDPGDIAKIEAMAETKGLSYTTLVRMWVKEHLAAQAEGGADDAQRWCRSRVVPT